MPKVFVHIVTWNSAKYINNCVAALLNSHSFALNKDFIIAVTDNASTDGTVNLLKELQAAGKIQIVNYNKYNLGFAAGHNQGVGSFLKSDTKYLLILNPDLAVEKEALSKICKEEFFTDRTGVITGKILRADENLTAIIPPVIDSTGITFTNSYRHFDKGNGEKDVGQYDQQQFVEGSTGAFLLMSKEFVLGASISAKYDRDAERVYPQLSFDREQRQPLFDEAFFAYREDADLALRAKLLGWKYLYLPVIVGFHVRKVTPEKRNYLDPEINSMSVRNRFLLQINNFSIKIDYKKILPGLLFRNLIVILGVLIKEQYSLKGLKELWLLLRRSFIRRMVILNKSH